MLDDMGLPVVVAVRPQSNSVSVAQGKARMARRLGAGDWAAAAVAAALREIADSDDSLDFSFARSFIAETPGAAAR